MAPVSVEWRCRFWRQGAKTGFDYIRAAKMGVQLHPECVNGIAIRSGLRKPEFNYIRAGKTAVQSQPGCVKGIPITSWHGCNLVSPSHVSKDIFSLYDFSVALLCIHAVIKREARQIVNVQIWGKFDWVKEFSLILRKKKRIVPFQMFLVQGHQAQLAKSIKLLLINYLFFYNKWSISMEHIYWCFVLCRICIQQISLSPTKKLDQRSLLVENSWIFQKISEYTDET